VADYQLTQLIGPLKVVDARAQTENEPIPRAFLDSIAVRPGDVVLHVVGYVPPSAVGVLPRYPAADLVVVSGLSEDAAGGGVAAFARCTRSGGYGPLPCREGGRRGWCRPEPLR